MFLVELVKGRKCALSIPPPLFVFDDNGEYTQEMEMIFVRKPAQPYASGRPAIPAGKG